MSQKRDLQSGDSGITGVREWLTEYGDMVVLLMVFFVLLYTISWATEERQAEYSQSLVAASYTELKSFCERELLPEDYQLERVTKGVLIHLPANRWFQSGQPMIKSGMVEKLEKLSHKISALKLFTHAPMDESGRFVSREKGQDDILRLQLSIRQIPEQAGRTLEPRSDDLFLARANQLATALNETLRVQDYQFEIHPNPSGISQVVWADAPRWRADSHSDLMLLISASLKSD
ncbi:MAG: hypothetical protein K9N11_10070 [Lentisphaeria bacterium]|nr:hypothetical protein [Candidatus Neomarinimicrobiota bacterium]MCF7843178.1 hypothetical protein [Lentisphaeria bacterium]